MKKRSFCLLLCAAMLLCGCQLTPATTVPATTQPPTTTAPLETQPSPEFTLADMNAIIEDAHEYYYSHESFALPITPYTEYYCNILINWYGAKIEYDDEHILFAKDDTMEPRLIYLIFLNTMLTEYADQVGWITKGRDVKLDDPKVLSDLNDLVFYPEWQKAGYDSIDAYATSWPIKDYRTPYFRFIISFYSMSVRAWVDDKSYSCFHTSAGEGEAPYYDGTWREMYT